MTPKEKRAEKASWHAGLWTRAANCAKSIGVTSREELLAAYQAGELIPLRFPRNYGWLAHKAVAAWLGLPEPMKRTAAEWEKQKALELKRKAAEVDFCDWD